MLIDTHKAVQDLKEAGADERLAEAIVRNISRADSQVATKHDLELLGETLRKEMRATEIRLYVAIATATSLLAALNFFT